MNPSAALSERLTVAIDAVAEACRVTRHVQQRLAQIGQHSKNDRSPVTVADYASQAVIAARLTHAFGSVNLAAEENADTLREAGNGALRTAVAEAASVVWGQTRAGEVLDAIDLGRHDATAGTYWTLDPIDGTKGFLRGGQYAVSLALIEHGQVILGVLGCPNLSADHARSFDDPDERGCLFFAERGTGSWTTPADAPSMRPQRIRVNTGDEVAGMRVCESVEAAHSRLDDAARIAEFLGATGEPARLDSQCKYAVVARGQADVYLRLPTRKDYVEKIWDHAAGKIVAEEAGAVVSDVRARPLDFSHGIGLAANRGIICAAPGFHAPIRDAIVSLGLFASD